MAKKPRWLTIAASWTIVALVVLACTPAAPPATDAPATDAPATTAPATDAPATDAPATDAPATDAPATDAPATDAPATDAPATDAPPAGLSYPEGEVTCASGDTPGSYNGVAYNGNLKLLEAPDDSTVVFTLCATDVAFLQKLAFAPFAVNDSAYLEANNGGGADFIRTMNGTGPYRLDEWRAGDSLLFSTFENYWGAAPLTNNAVLRWASDSATRLTDLLGAQVHAITNVGVADFATIEADPNVQLVQPPAGEILNVLYVGMNQSFDPWSDVNVRRAVGLALDRQRIVDNFYPAGSEVASHFAPSALDFASEGEPWPDQDLAAAQQLMNDAGYEDGFDTVINYRVVDRGYLPRPADVATDIAAQLAAIGIRATPEEQESGTFIENSNNGALEGLFLLGWGADYPDVSNFLDFHFGPGCTSAFGPCYPEIATPLARGVSSADPEIRRQAYEEANNAIRDLVPMVPVANGAFALGYAAGVQGAQASSLSNEYLWAMAPADGGQIVFMQNAEPIGVYCADETDGESLRACLQSMEGLYGYEVNGSGVEPKLATACEPNDDATQWTCSLRSGVNFHDGATFEAQDVITSFAAMWDAGHALHTGNSGAFEYWPGLWGDFLNAQGE